MNNIQKPTFDSLPLLVGNLIIQINSLEDMIRELKLEIEEVKRSVATSPIKSPRSPIGLDRVAEITGKSKATLYRYTAQGLIPCYKRGKSIYFFEDEIYDWIKRGKLEELELAHKDDLCSIVPLGHHIK